MSTQPRTESPFANRTLVMVAAVLAILAFVFNFFYINRILRQQESGAFDVLIAHRDLPPDTVIDEADVEKLRVPGTFRDKLKNVVMGEQFNQVKGNTIKRGVGAGAVLFWEYINPELTDSPARVIDPRYRGVTVRINAESTPTALLRPGGYVDLVGTVRTPAGPPETMTVMEYVRVIATGGVVQPPSEDPTSRKVARPQSFRDITLALRPEDGEKLRAIETHMEGRGFIIHARNPADDSNRWGKGAFNPKLDSLLAGAGETPGG